MLDTGAYVFLHSQILRFLFFVLVTLIRFSPKDLCTQFMELTKQTAG